MTTASADPLIGRLIDGRYQVRSRIARGGMATVYLATDLRLERRVAIKIMHGHLADDNVFFENSSVLIGKLQHENVPFEMMLYPGETHRSGVPKLQAHRWNTIFRFLERNGVPGGPR